MKCRIPDILPTTDSEKGAVPWFIAFHIFQYAASRLKLIWESKKSAFPEGFSKTSGLDKLMQSTGLSQ
jgi:hypothetical protein